MKITSAQWKQLNSLFQSSADLDIDDRETYLDANCPDPELRKQVNQLLRHDTDNRNTLKNKISSQAVDLLSTVKIGETLGAYTIDSELGEGGMGTVYLASRSDNSFDKRVAIKILHNKLATEPEKERFLSERQILAHMEHANIARLLDGGACGDGSPYLVMEYVEGDSIDEYCQREQLSIKKRLNLIIQVGAAIQFAHRNQIIHCDIKPSNIIVNRDGVPKLVDFGISQLLNLPKSNSDADRGPMTPIYASPEQLEGKELDERSDVYALGIVIHEILTGERPANDETSEREFLDNHPVKLDRDLWAILGRALKMDKTKRYQSMDDFVDDLNNYLKKRPVYARKQTLAYQSYKFGQRNPVSLSAALLFIVLSLPFLYFNNSVYQLSDHEIEEIIKLHTSSASENKVFKIAVIPFISKRQEGVARQLTEGLTLDLSRLNQFHVIDEDTTSQMKPSDIDYARLKNDLDIDYFIQGIIKFDGNTIYADISLFDVLEHSQIWQTTFSRPLVELNSLQEKLSTKIVESFNLTLTQKEKKRLGSRYTASRAAYSYFSQGLYQYGQRIPEANLIARENIEKAIEIDPEFARAYAVLANTYRIDFMNRWNDNPEESLRLAKRFIKMALSLDADLAQAHFVSGLIYRDQKSYSEAMASAASAIALSPSYADAFILLASVMCYADMSGNSVELIKKAIRLNPDHPVNYKFHLGQCQYVSGQVDQAVATFEEAIERNPSAQRTNIWLAASYAKTGRIDDAEWIVDELLSRNPALTVGYIKKVMPFIHADDVRNFAKHLLLAGLPE
jgi:serine/threonine protein kinase/cytochrome c-type biogenesis protein CcmH/NrfG